MASSLVFTVQREEPVLVTPAKPTPHELKPLSDIDQIPRWHMATVSFYGCNPCVVVDPVETIRGALAEALVLYYPLAGRLREDPNGKLVVDCNAEGVLFVEADADVRLDQFGDQVQLPIPCVDELICDREHSGIVGCPLVLIQVTRLKCGGFIFACRYNHTMADAPGINQFMSAMTETARGSDTPSITPVWARELLTAENPPQITHSNQVSELKLTNISAPVIVTDSGDMVLRSFFFGPKEISYLRNYLSLDMRRSSSKFEVLSAYIWRCRSLALYCDPNLEVSVRFTVNARGKNKPLLPVGYYGNAFVRTVARTTVGELGSKPLSYAVELVKKAKGSITDGRMQSVADLMALGGRPPVAAETCYVVSDATNSGFDGLDFGWGRPVYSGAARAFGGRSFYTRGKNRMGEVGTLVPMSLPKKAMEKFVKEIETVRLNSNL